ncbi:MAG: substrate-binding domain-containing protein [Planctomycetes bacterium]|nr:substrate-binding domain-containing protein [Planctomycetota bacterium]
MKHPALRLKVYDVLLRKLASRAWTPGSRCPSIRDLARNLKTSRQPVQQALQMAVQNRLLTTRSTRRAVVLPGADRRAADLLAEDHLTAQRRTLAVLIPEEFFPLRGAPYQHRLAKVVAAAAATRGWECRIVKIPAEDQSKSAGKVVRQYDAAFVVDVSPRKPAFLFTLAEYGFPMLSFRRQAPGIDHPVLTINEYGASQQLGRLMVEHGHRNLCFIASLKHEYTDGPKSAVKGWTDFLDKVGLLATSTMPLAYYNIRTPDVFLLLMEQLLRLSPRITGFVFHVPPHLAFLASDGKFRDLRIPHDVSIAVMSSMAGVSWPAHLPPVTSFEVDWDRAGHCAVEMIDQLLAGNPHPKSIRVPLNIQLTDSIGPAPKHPRHLSAHGSDAPSLSNDRPDAGDVATFA